MSVTKEFAAALICWLGCVAVHAAQAPLLEEVRTVSSAVTPVESAAFTIAAAGLHEITLTDLGALVAPAAPVAAIQLAVMQGPTVLTRLIAAGTTQVNLPVGSYVIRVAGLPGPNAGSGLFSASVRAASAPLPLFSFNNVLSETAPLVPGHVRLFQGSVTLPAGNYQTELVDLTFPQALSNASVIVTSGATVASLLNLPATPADHATFSVGATGTYPILALGDSPAATNAGLFMVRIRDAVSNAIVFSQLLSVGRVASFGVTPNLAVGSYTLVGADLAFPAALAQSGALIASSANIAQPVVVARLTAPGSLAFSVTGAGAHEVFGLAVPGTTPGGGVLGVEVRSATATLHSVVRAVGGDAVSGTPVFAFPVDIAGTDTYTATATDMQFPAGLSALNVAIARGAAVLARRDLAGSLSAVVAPGRAYILVAAKPAAGTAGTLQQAGGLIGVQLSPTSGDPLMQVTQGVGGVFSVRSFAIGATGDYRFTLDDVGFPAQFSELAAAVTRGTERLGLIYGAGSFDVLQATPGSYYINFLTRPDAITKAGTYHLSATVKPPAPAITLSANPHSPAVGAMVDLSWAVQDATSCVGSGAWSGSRALTGTERSAALNTAATFTLTCIGVGGSATKSLTVTPAALDTSKKSGGGALGLLALLGLLGMAFHRKRSIATNV